MNLTPYHIRNVTEAMKIAELRQLESTLKNCNPSTTYKDEPWEVFERNIHSVLAELVIGRKFCPNYLPSTNTFHKIADVAEDIEVRSSTNPNSPLWVRKNDDIARRYVLVISHAMKGYSVRGWMYGYEIATDKYWHEPEEHERVQRPSWRYHGPLRPWDTLTKERPKDAAMELEIRW